MATTIPQGEVKEVISDAQSNGRYMFNVESGDVILGRTKSEAKRGHGRKVESGYKGEIVTERRGESVWAYAPANEVKVSVKRSGFHVNLMPRRETVSPADAAVESQEVVFANDSGTVSSATSTQSQMMLNDTIYSDNPEVWRVHWATGWFSSTANSIEVGFEIQDGNGNVSYKHKNLPEHFPLEYPEPFPLPPDHSLLVDINNNSSSSVDYHVSAYVTKGVYSK